MISSSFVAFNWNFRLMIERRTLDHDLDLSRIAAEGISRLASVSAAIVEQHAAHVQIQRLALLRKLRKLRLLLQPLLAAGHWSRRQLKPVIALDQLIAFLPVDGQRQIARHFTAQPGLRSARKRRLARLDPHACSSCSNSIKIFSMLRHYIQNKFKNKFTVNNQQIC